MIGAKHHDQKELYSLNRALRWCMDGLVFAETLRHGREVVDELELSRSKPVSSPATVDGVTRCQGDELKPLDEEGKRLYQWMVAKLNYLAQRSTGPKVCNFMSGKCCLVAWPRGHASGEAGWTYLRKAPVAWLGFPFHDPRPGELLCYTDADWASDKTSRRSTSGSVVTLGGGVLNCWTKKQNSVALSSWRRELFAALMSGARSLVIQSELMDLWHSCSVTVATDSESVIDHSRRRGHSMASKNVGVRGHWLQESLVDGKLKLEKVNTATNPADVCTKGCLKTESASSGVRVL